MNPVLLAAALPFVVQDTTRPRPLDPIVVTAERSPASLSASATATTRLSARELARMPSASIADLLRLAPGFAVVDFDGLGFDPQVMVRGFYGGGEAEYVLVQIDGKAVNQVMNGVVAWDALPPLASIEAIEIVRGGASALYGDAAIGGIINVITRSAEATPQRGFQVDLGWGSHRTSRLAIDGAAPSLGGLSFSAGRNRTAGYRDHAGRTATRAAAALPLTRNASGHLRFSVRGHWRDFDEPGPLLESLLELNRRASDVLFRFDHSDDRAIGAGLEAERQVGSSVRLSGSSQFEARRIHAVRTLALAPGFGDTKERHANTTRATLNGQIEVRRLWRGDLVAGIEAGRHSLTSRYYAVAGGSREEYAGADGARGDLDDEGWTDRYLAAAYFQYSIRPTRHIRATAGSRFDVLDDQFNRGAGDPGSGSTHSALSPKLGLNFRYVETARGSGNAYVSWSRSFKAPTLDQKYDLRSIPIPFPPFEVTTSNPGLEPQRGSTIEAGMYQTIAMSGTGLAQLSVAAYHTQMSDELDFDVENFRYVNIGASRHRGVEAGARIEGHRISATTSYALQDAVARQGANAGKRLKAIPRHSWHGGLSVRPLRREGALEAGIGVTRLSGMFFDDASTRAIPGYTRVEARIVLRSGEYALHVDGRNLFGSRHSSTGFLDPSGSGEAYLYPVAGRVLELGIRSTW